MAVLLERRFGNFRDSLLTRSSCPNSRTTPPISIATCCAHTQRDALERASNVDLGKVFNTAPLVRRVSLAAIALVVAAVVFAVAVPEALAIWARRTLLISDELWPRQTHLLVEGFDRERSQVKIARGSDWKLAVQGRRRHRPRDS